MTEKEYSLDYSEVRWPAYFHQLFLLAFGPGSYDPHGNPGPEL